MTNFAILWMPERAQIKQYMQLHSGGIPNEYDRVLMPTCRTALKRDLQQSEKQLMRQLFRKRMDGA